MIVSKVLTLWLIAFIGLVSTADMANKTHIQMESVNLSKNNEVKTFYNWGEEYSVSFYFIKKDNQPADGALNILHMSAGDCCHDLGDRIPAVFSKQATSSKGVGQGVVTHTLEVRCTVNGFWDYATSFEFQLNQLYHVEILQEKEGEAVMYTVKIDGNVYHSIRNTQVKVFDNVILYLTSPWNEPFGGDVRNLEVINGKRTTTSDTERKLGGCPFSDKNVEEIDGKCYYFNQNFKNMYSAETFCKSAFGQGREGKLYEPKDKDTYDKIVSFARQKIMKTEGFWIGISDLSVENKFEYRSNGDIYFDSWKEGEPSSANGSGDDEDCVYFTSKNGKWNDMKCTAMRLSICEIVIPPQCLFYQELTKKDRSAQYITDIYWVRPYCDNSNTKTMDNPPDPAWGVRGTSPDWLGAYWYRILPPAGNQIAEGVVDAVRCGAWRSIYLDGTHPKIEGETEQRTICGNALVGVSELGPEEIKKNPKQGECDWFQDINITNCGDYFVYKLPEVKKWGGRYCTEFSACDEYHMKDVNGEYCVTQCADNEIINLDGNQCVKKCAHNEIINLAGNQCVEKCEEEEDNGGQNQCVCKKDKLKDSAGYECIAQCPDEEYPNDADDQCDDGKSHGLELGLEYSSYMFEKAALDLGKDANIVKTFPEFGLEWSVNFTLTILENSAVDPIMIIADADLDQMENVYKNQTAAKNTLAVAVTHHLNNTLSFAFGNTIGRYIGKTCPECKMVGNNKVYPISVSQYQKDDKDYLLVIRLDGKNIFQTLNRSPYYLVRANVYFHTHSAETGSDWKIEKVSIEKGRNYNELCDCFIKGTKSCTNLNGLCECNDGYEGFDCKSCATFYSKNDLGDCQVAKCSPDGTETMVEDSNDGSIICHCKTGFSGDTCEEKCNENKFGTPTQPPSDSCQDCNCPEETSFHLLPCDHATGKCHCKDIFMGLKCNICPPLTVGTPPDCEISVYVSKCEIYNMKSLTSKQDYLELLDPLEAEDVVNECGTPDDLTDDLIAKIETHCDDKCQDQKRKVKNELQRTEVAVNMTSAQAAKLLDEQKKSLAKVASLVAVLTELPNQMMENADPKELNAQAIKKLDKAQKLGVIGPTQYGKMKTKIDDAFEFDPLWTTSYSQIVGNIQKGIDDQISMNDIKYEKNGKKPGVVKKYSMKIGRHMKGMSKTQALTKLGEAGGLLASAAQKVMAVNWGNVTTADAVTIVSGVLDIVTLISQFLPPPINVLTGTVTSLVSVFLPGPSVPSNSDVIDTMGAKFLEQESFIRNSFTEQRLFITSKFDEMKNYNKELFNEELLREMKNNALALLDTTIEKYDYILPQANAVLTEMQALDLDQHANILDSFEAGKVKYAITDRCSQVFSSTKEITDADIETRKLCTLLIDTYFAIEKFRDITLAQLIVILEGTKLKPLNDGYLITMSDRREDIETFIKDYLSEGKDMFCHLFMPCQFMVNCPWISDEVKNRVEDYVKFISYNSDTTNPLSNIHEVCSVNTHVKPLLYSESRNAEGWGIHEEKGKWIEGETDADQLSIISQCDGRNQWYGWSKDKSFTHPTVGSISTKLFSAEEYHSGAIKKCGLIEFTNCGIGGVVKVYLNDKLIGDAEREGSQLFLNGYSTYRTSQNIEFPIYQESQLVIKDEGYQSAIKFTNFEMVECSNKGPFMLVVGGAQYDNNGVIYGTWKNNAHVYDLNSPHGDPILPSFPTNVSEARGGIINNKVLICGGMTDLGSFGTDTALNSCQAYDPSSNKWGKFCDLRNKRMGHASATLHDGSIWITGGYHGINLMSSTEIIHSDKTTAVGTSLKEALVYHCMVTLHDGRIMIIGGAKNLRGFNPTTSSRKVRIFDPDTFQWSTGPDLKTGDRQHFGCALMESPTTAGEHAVLIAGGVQTREVELYEYEKYEKSGSTPHWNTMQSLPTTAEHQSFNGNYGDYVDVQLVTSPDGKGVFLLNIERFYEFTCESGNCQWLPKKKLNMRLVQPSIFLLPEQGPQLWKLEWNGVKKYGTLINKGGLWNGSSDKWIFIAKDDNDRNDNPLPEGLFYIQKTNGKQGYLGITDAFKAILEDDDQLDSILWKKGETNAEGYFTIENSKVPNLFLTVASAVGDLDVKDNISLRM